MKKVLLMLAEGFEEVEAITPVDLLRRAGIDCQTVSVTGELLVKGAQGISVMADKLFDIDEVLKADAIILPGGMPGTLGLQNHSGLKEAILAFNNDKKIIAAICAAPMILGAMGLLKGKNALIYPGMEKELVGATCLEANVIRDEHIITSRGVGTAMPFALVIIETLTDASTMEEVRNSIVFTD